MGILTLNTGLKRSGSTIYLVWSWPGGDLDGKLNDGRESFSILYIFEPQAKDDVGSRVV
jgi:hypothetical protein